MLIDDKRCQRASGSDTSAISAICDITIPDVAPGDPARNQIPIRIEFDRTWGQDKLILAIELDAAPDLTPTLRHYRIRSTMRVSVGGKEAGHEFVHDASVARGITKLVIDVPAGQQGRKVVLDYTLDLTNNDRMRDPRAIGREYKDRILRTCYFATFRGDVVFLPMFGNEDAPAVEIEYQLTMPAGWTLAVNAETEQHGDSWRWQSTIPAMPGFNVQKWFAVAGELLIEDVPGHAVRRLIAPAKYEDAPADGLTPGSHWRRRNSSSLTMTTCLVVSCLSM